jgi:hypothetical protein
MLAPTPPVPSDAHFLAPAFVRDLVRELTADAFFGPIVRGAAATLGRPVDRHGVAILDASRSPPGGVVLVRCGLLYRRGPGSADRLCVPAGGGLRTQVLGECHEVLRECRLDDASVGPRLGRWYAASPSEWGRIAMWSSMSARVRRANG